MEVLIEEVVEVVVVITRKGLTFLLSSSARKCSWIEYWIKRRALCSHEQVVKVVLPEKAME